jgi:hypothetical protein
MRYAAILGLQMLLCAMGLLFPKDKPINSETPLTVWQVLQNLPAYAGKIIQVRGEWHGGYLDEDCPTPLKTEKHEWPNSILLVYPSNLRKEDQSVEYGFMTPADYDQLFLNTLKNYKKMRATVSGRLDAKAELFPDPRSGEPRPYGYGHLNYWPARIIMMEIKDIKGTVPRGPGDKMEIIPFE